MRDDTVLKDGWYKVSADDDHHDCPEILREITVIEMQNKLLSIIKV